MLFTLAVASSIRGPGVQKISLGVTWINSGRSGGDSKFVDTPNGAELLF
jgi:hypothetical protein